MCLQNDNLCSKMHHLFIVNHSKAQIMCSFVNKCVQKQLKHSKKILPICLDTGVTFTPCGVTIVGVTTLMPDTVVGVVCCGVVPCIFWVAAAAAANAAIPVI
jgi:hypothetical protein